MSAQPQARVDAMIKPARPEREAERLAELEQYRILDSESEQAYDDLLTIVASICNAPMGSVTLLDSDRQWFKASKGIDASETSRDIAFCAHAILEPDRVFEVPDSHTDPRFSDNPFVTGKPNIRFYAGAPLVSPSGNALGTLCVMDTVPRHLSPAQSDALMRLSRQVVALMELRRAYARLHHHHVERDWYENQLKRYQDELEQENAALAEQSRTDVLTGLPNRRAFIAALEPSIAHVADGRPLHVAIIDIDHFKTVNDLHGHVAGDETLAAIGRAIHAQCGPHGFAARLGGEEFALLMPDIDAFAAEMQCEYLREAVQNLPVNIPATISIGVAAARADDTSSSLCTRADEALYAAKRGGRNRVVIADASTAQKADVGARRNAR